MGVQSQCCRIKGGSGVSGIFRNDQFRVALKLTIRFSDLRKKKKHRYSDFFFIYILQILKCW